MRHNHIVKNRYRKDIRNIAELDDYTDSGIYFINDIWNVYNTTPHKDDFKATRPSENGRDMYNEMTDTPMYGTIFKNTINGNPREVLDVYFYKSFIYEKYFQLDEFYKKYEMIDYDIAKHFVKSYNKGKADTLFNRNNYNKQNDTSYYSDIPSLNGLDFGLFNSSGREEYSGALNTAYSLSTKGGFPSFTNSDKMYPSSYRLFNRFFNKLSGMYLYENWMLSDIDPTIPIGFNVLSSGDTGVVDNGHTVGGGWGGNGSVYSAGVSGLYTDRSTQDEPEVLIKNGETFNILPGDNFDRLGVLVVINTENHLLQKFYNREYTFYRFKKKGSDSWSNWKHNFPNAGISRSATVKYGSRAYFEKGYRISDRFFFSDYIPGFGTYQSSHVSEAGRPMEHTVVKHHDDMVPLKGTVTEPYAEFEYGKTRYLTRNYLENLLPKNTNSDVNYLTSTWINALPPKEGTNLEAGLPIVHKFTSSNNKIDRELGYKAVDHYRMLNIKNSNGAPEYINTSKYLSILHHPDLEKNVYNFLTIKKNEKGIAETLVGNHLSTLFFNYSGGTKGLLSKSSTTYKDFDFAYNRPITPLREGMTPDANGKNVAIATESSLKWEKIYPSSYEGEESRKLNYFGSVWVENDVYEIIVEVSDESTLSAYTKFPKLFHIMTNTHFNDLSSEMLNNSTNQNIHRIVPKSYINENPFGDNVNNIQGDVFINIPIIEYDGRSRMLNLKYSCSINLKTGRIENKRENCKMYISSVYARKKKTGLTSEPEVGEEVYFR